MVSSITFGDTSPQIYTFTNIQSYSDTFTDVVAQTTRLPAVSGGFDIYGDTPAPKAVGQVRVTFKLSSSTKTGMTALRRAVRAMTEWGVQKIIMQPSDSGEDTVYCYGRVNNINISQRPADNTDLIQSVTVIFQVADPYWRQSTASSDIISASGTSTDQVVANDGNATTLPIITIAPAATDTCQNPEIRRIVGGNIADAIGWTGTLTDTDTLIINCQTGAITLNGSDDWANKDETNTTHPDWLRLPPGDNTIRVVFANIGDAADVTLDYEDTYH